MDQLRVPIMERVRQTLSCETKYLDFVLINAEIKKTQHVANAEIRIATSPGKRGPWATSLTLETVPIDKHIWSKL